MPLVSDRIPGLSLVTGKHDSPPTHMKLSNHAARLEKVICAPD